MYRISRDKEGLRIGSVVIKRGCVFGSRDKEGLRIGSVVIKRGCV